MKILKLKKISDADFITGERAIAHMLRKNKKATFEFLIEDAGKKKLRKFGPDNITEELIDQNITISDDVSVQFHSDGSIEMIEGFKEALIRQRSLDQLKKLRKMTKGIDIADRIPDLQKQGANIHYSRNAVDSGIESYEDFQSHNKKFVPSWNLKHLTSPFKGEK